MGARSAQCSEFKKKQKKTQTPPLNAQFGRHYTFTYYTLAKITNISFYKDEGVSIKTVKFNI